MGQKVVSRCSAGNAVKLRWFGVPQCQVGDDIETAIAALVSAVEQVRGSLGRNEKAMARAEFRQRLKKAESGMIKPVHEVKRLREKAPLPLFEIRWQTIPAGPKKSDGRLPVRLIHTEPVETPSHFIAHQAHVKVVRGKSDLEIRNSQDESIDAAIRWYEVGQRSVWGLSGL